MWSIPLLVLVVVGCAAVTSARSGKPKPRMIKWSPGCTEYQSKKFWRPAVAALQTVSDSDPFDCYDRCTEMRDCGGYDVTRGGLCKLMNVNDDVIQTYLKPHWMVQHASANWYSKKCHYDIGVSEPSCVGFPVQHPGQYIHWRSGERVAASEQVPGVTAGECQAWCLLYPDCRSVTHEVNTQGGWGYCYLYNATIPGLRRRGRDRYVEDARGPSSPSSGFSTFITYDRMCRGGAYKPGPAALLPEKYARGYTFGD